MKAFTITTGIGIGLLILVGLIIATLKIEKHKAQIEAHTRTIDSLSTELHTMEVMYLKCVGSVEVEQHGAHYVDGSIKFYKTK